MITVCLNEANFEYDIHSLVKAFYAKEDVKVFADRERICWLEREVTPLFHMEIAFRQPGEQVDAGDGGGCAAQGELGGWQEPGEQKRGGGREGCAVQESQEAYRDREGQVAFGNSGKGQKGWIEIRLLLPPAGEIGASIQAEAESGRQSCAESMQGIAAFGGRRGRRRRSRRAEGGGKAFEDGGYTLGIQGEVEADFSDRKETKNILKRCLYRLLSEYTGQSLPWGTLTGIRPTKIAMSMLEQGKGEGAVRAFMAGTYLASEQKVGLSIEIAKREMELLEAIDYQEGYSMYIGIPFCPSICSYCSFSSSPIGLWKDKVDAYLAALEKEIVFTAAAYSNKKLNSVYIGGGTPTTLSPQQLDWILNIIESRFNLSDLVEYTVEAGRPDSITREKLQVLCSHGIFRISINPQTMKQETLDLIGRRHTVGQAVESFALAREMGFENINMDLILGLPRETLEDVQNTLEQVKALAPDSLTVHSLAMKRAARLKMFPEEYQGMEMENSWETVDLAAHYAREMGLAPYYLYRQKNMAGNFENVGYAAPGKAGLYNVLMMEEKQSIVALGAGSISKRVYPDGRIERCENVKDVALYIQKIDEMMERKRKLLTDF